MEYALDIENLGKCYALRKQNKKLGMALYRVKSISQMWRGLPIPEPEENHPDYLWALQDFNLKVKPGEVIGIIGRNGAGKSTLLKLLAKVSQPSKGKVLVHGRIANLLELGFGFNPEFSVRENVYINGNLNSMTNKQIDEVFDSIVAFAGLEDFVDEALKHCPSGSPIRLAYATVTHLDADILLADEILAVGDADFQKDCFDHIKQSQITGQAVLFVSHDMKAIKEICHRVVWLDKGKIRQMGDPDEVIPAYIHDLSKNRSKKITSSGVRYVRLLDQQTEEKDTFEVKEPIIIESSIHASQPGAYRMRYTINYKSKIALDIFQPSPIDVEAEGNYFTHTTLPAEYLNDLNYTLTATLEYRPKENRQFTACDKGTKTNFKLIVSDAVNASVKKAGREHPVMPPLIWRCKSATPQQ